MALGCDSRDVCHYPILPADLHERARSLRGGVLQERVPKRVGGHEGRGGGAPDRPTREGKRGGRGRQRRSDGLRQREVDPRTQPMSGRCRIIRTAGQASAARCKRVSLRDNSVGFHAGGLQGYWAGTVRSARLVWGCWRSWAWGAPSKTAGGRRGAGRTRTGEGARRLQYSSTWYKSVLYHVRVRGW